MAVAVKICGLNSPEALDAAVQGGAVMVGFVFYSKSPRWVSPAEAARLGQRVPKTIARVGLIVDESDQRIGEILRDCPLDILQLHGAETPARCREIKARHGLPVIKVIKLASKDDLGAIDEFQAHVDYLMFDAKPPPEHKDALPGGNALSFDWSLLKGLAIARPWLLSGGLNADNLARAVRETGARLVDLSSGVEDRPGVKNPRKIKEFLDLARSLTSA